jgi:parallel beta-helix repeat protein
VQLYYGGNVIEYNYMHDQPRWAVALPFSRGGHNTVRYNEMLRTCLETGDCGPIHTSRGANKDEVGGEICYNLIVDSPGMTTDGSGHIASPHYGWGIYLDGFASGYHVHHNVVANNAYGGVFIHGGDRNVIENNIFLNSSYYQVCLGVGLNPDMKDNKIVRNVFRYTDKNAVMYYCMGSGPPKPGNTIDSNLYCHEGLPLEVINYGGLPSGTDSWKAWQNNGFDAHSLIADPMFEDLAHGDYRLKPTSPGLELGFEQIDLSRTGLKGYRR